MLNDQQSVEQSKRNRRNDKHIYRRDTIGLIAKKGLPALGRWPPSLGPVFCNRGLTDIDPELEQFAMNPGRSPSEMAMLISRMSRRRSAEICGRPPPGRDLQRQ
jgi:hypothetical protein